MSYTVTQLINAAYYTSGVVAREFQTVSGTQLNDGLGFLNDLLTDKTVEDDMIPYYSEYNFTAVQGQEEYFIPNLILTDTLVFFIDGVRYQMSQIPRRQYFGTSRADNIQTLPFTWHIERCFGGANLFLYFLPNTTYAMQLWGLFRLTEVDINQNLSLTLDRFYISYLKYALTVRICVEFNYEIPPGVSMQLKKYEQWISKRSQQLDLRSSKISTLGQSNSINYAQINLGLGWSV